MKTIRPVTEQLWSEIVRTGRMKMHTNLVYFSALWSTEGLIIFWLFCLCSMKTHSGLYVFWTLLTSFPLVTAASTQNIFRKIMSVCCSVGLVDIIFLFLLLFVSLLIRENGSVLHSHLISQRETSHFLFHSSESATAGQTLGYHLGLIFGFSGWRLKA